MSENLYQPNFSMPEFKSLQPAPGGILINFLEQHPDGSSPDEEFNRRLLITKEGEKLLAQVVSPDIDPNHESILPKNKSILEINGEQGIIRSLDPNRNGEVTMIIPVNNIVKEALNKL